MRRFQYLSDRLVREFGDEDRLFYTYLQMTQTHPTPHQIRREANIYQGLSVVGCWVKGTVSAYDTYCFVLQKTIFYTRSDSTLGLFRYHLRGVEIIL